MRDPLLALSPLDGRYVVVSKKLENYFSEFALFKYRIKVEIEWFIYLANSLKLPRTRVLKTAEIKFLRKIYLEFKVAQASKVKELEKITNHDVKAVEYFLRSQVKELGIDDLTSFIHFGCTSEDINNLAYALLITDALASELIPAIKTINQELREKAQLYKDVSVLSRTHGQPASPTTIGKELVVYIVRLERQLKIVESVDFLGKMNGATGNFNAHVVAYPKVDWIAASEKFVRGLSLTPNLYTTQIESHDFLAELFDALRRINTVLLDFSRDMWLYISFDVFKQTVKKEEVGSSTMPHKVNPIDFENAEGNLGMANALFEHFSAKLPISRLQRDLSDSTVLRNIGVAFGYSLLAYKSLSKGLGKVDLNYDKIAQDLENNLGVLSEAIQSVMRSHKQEGAYEELKELTRGKKLTKDLLLAFIRKLDIPMIEKEMLIKLTPADYTGLAGMLVERHMK